MRGTPDPRPQNWHAERVVEAVAHAAAEFIRDEAGTNSLITVTRAVSLSKGDRVIVFVDVLPSEQVKNALDFLARKREDFSAYLKAHTKLGALPRIDFQLESGELDALPPLEAA